MATAGPITEDLTTCPVCLDIYDNPKSLPCLHAFCLNCLQGTFRNNSPGDTASCPVCSKEFEIPSDGVGALQHHFIVQQLVDRIHQRQSSCDKHADKEVELYCHDCRENICLLCSAVSHRNHNSTEIREVADSFRSRIDEDAQQILSVISSLREQAVQTKQDATEFLSKVDSVKKTVLATGDVVRRSVDNQINDMLTKLESVTSESANQAKKTQKAYQQTLVSMESFHGYLQELLDKGRPSDITRAARELHDRATELLDSDVTAVKYLSLIHI